MKSNKNAHIIQFDETLQSIEIHRNLPDNSKIFLTRISFEHAKEIGFESIAMKIGELLLLDSPAARKIFEL
jgi:hypothetical protein